MAGFFQSQAPTATGLRIPLLPECGICKLDKGCHSPKMKVFGQGRKGIMVVGEAPGKTEDEQGRPFIGESGQLLAKTMDRFRVDLYEDCWIVNAARCRPENNKLPEKAIGHCRPNVKNDIERLKPRVLILLGGSAVKSVLAWLWGEDVGAISRWDGWTIPCQRINCWICPTWHPSYILRTGYGVSGKENDVRQLLFERHIKAACELQGRPKVTDWDKRLITCMNDHEAASWIRLFAKGDRPVVFDFETDRLAPYHKDARIVTCAVSDGKFSISFPWMGEAIEAMKELLQSPVPKWGFNINFEQRWSTKEFGVPVNNWQWCGMLGAHVLDNRPEICSAEYQSFIRLGVNSWKDSMAPYMKAKTRAGGNNAPNRVPEAPLPDLLKYGAKDALHEWHLARDQQKELKSKSNATQEAYQLLHDGSLALARMQDNGIRVDVPYLESAIADVTARIKTLDVELKASKEWMLWLKLQGPKANIDSLQQLGALVYKQLGHKAHYTQKSYDGDKLIAKPRYKTDEATLEAVDLPFVKKYFEAAHLKKAKSTYLDGLLREVVDGYVHPDFHLHTVRTYRSSSSAPNIMNQPVRNPEIGDIVRRSFMARSKRRRLVEVDCSAHEFRRAADFWQDPEMIRSASDPSMDPHRDAAADMFLCKAKQVSKKMRYLGKNGFIFPTLYGSWWKKVAPAVWMELPGLLMADGKTLVLDWLAEQGITELGDCGKDEEPEPGTFQYTCQQVEQRFMQRFPVFARKKEEWYQAYRKEGGFSLVTGFWCNGIYSKNDTLNYPVQGPAFHILLWCIIELQRLLDKRQMSSLPVAEIHDCILADVPDSELQDYLNLIERVMTRRVRKAMKWILTPLDIEVDITPCGGAWSQKAPWIKNEKGVWVPKAA